MSKQIELVGVETIPFRYAQVDLVQYGILRVTDGWKPFLVFSIPSWPCFLRSVMPTFGVLFISFLPEVRQTSDMLPKANYPHRVSRFVFVSRSEILTTASLASTC
jgi:hypothetical protein